MTLADFVGGPWVGTFVIASLLTARLWAMLRVQALYRAALPGTWWAWSAGIAVALAVPIATVSPAEQLEVPWPGLTRWGVAVGFEVALGSVLGMLVALPGYAVIGAARESLARLRAEGSRAFTTLVAAVSIAGGFALGLHRPVVLAARATGIRWPVGSPERWQWSGGVDAVSELALAAAELSVLALALATPVLLSTAVVDLAAGWLGRATATRPFAAHSWFRFALSIAALGASWDAYGARWFA